MYVPTFNEAKTITENSEAFYFTTVNVNGYNVHMFNYRMATYDDFCLNNAWELRGLTYVEQPEQGSGEVEYRVFIMLNKFFNVGEVPNTKLELLKNLEIVSVQDKLDGSVIHFIPFPDGQIKAKSKMSFDSDQAIMAQEYYERSPNLQKFVAASIKDGYTPIFELVGSKNQIVLQYDETELRLIQIRNNKTGEYLPITYKPTAKFLNEQGIKTADFFINEEYPEFYDLDKLEEISKTKEGIEGWVISFSNGLKVKKKTNHYNLLHGTISEIREHDIIKLTLEEQIDDVLALLTEGEKRKFVEEIVNKTSNMFNHLVVEYKELRRKYFNDFEEDRKKFAIKHSKDKLFGAVIKGLNTSFRDIEETAEKFVKEHILKDTNSLSKARDWLDIL